MKKEFSVEDIKFSLDIGTRSVIGSAGIVKGTKIDVIKECYIEHHERAMLDGQIHDISLVTKTVKSVIQNLENELNVKLEKVNIAAAGRFLKTVNSKAELDLNKDESINSEWIKTLELKAIKEAEEGIAKEVVGELYCVGYSVVNYYLNGYIISNLLGHKGENISVEIIATFLPKSVVDSLYSVMDKCGLRVSSLTLEPIAAIEAVVPQKLRLLNIALVDIGAGTSDIAISADQSIVAYGMVPIAGDEVTEVIAKECLVDFNTAEIIKRQINTEEEIKFIDILGFECSRSSEKLKEVISPIVAEVGETIGEKIKELNGNKPPSAIFVVGGGAHTPGILEEIAKNSNIPKDRIAIKDRDSIESCIAENAYGSAGVTVIGIALVGLKNEGNDFVNVYLNHIPISLFNSHAHTVKDVLVHADIDPTMLMAKRGKNLRYTLNGVKKITFGNKGENAIIKVNGQEASIDSTINDGDEVNIIYAKNGQNAAATVTELLTNYEEKEIFINNISTVIKPIAIVNDNKVSLDTYISDQDIIEIIYPKNIGDVKKYIINTTSDVFINEVKANDEYIINNGDKLVFEDCRYSEENHCNNINESLIIEQDEKNTNCDKDNMTNEFSEELEDEAIYAMKVIVNDEEVKINDMSSMMFVQIFSYINFDLSELKGNIVLKLNGEVASYTDMVKDGDVINIYWEK